MKIKTNVNAGAANGDIYVGWKRSCRGNNHNHKVVRALKVKTNAKTGVGGNGDGAGSQVRHNQTVARGLKVKTGIKAGPPDTPTVRD